MPRLEFKHYCNLTAFRAVPASLYRDLLGKYADACRARGLDPATLADDDRSREALLAFFTQPGPDLPPELLRAMQEIDDLSNDAGHALLVQDAVQAGVRFPSESSTWDPRSLAIYCWVHKPRAFKASADRNFMNKEKAFCDFAGKDARQLALPTREWCDALAERLRPYFVQRLLGEASEVRSYVDADSINFVISHGRPFRSDEALDGVTPSMIAYRPRRHDHVLFDNRTCRLRVNGPDAPTVETYRASFGEACFGDADYFVRGPIVSLEPLLQRGEGALAWYGGVTMGALIEVWLEQGEERRPTTVIYKSRNVFRSAEDHDHVQPLRGRPIFAVLELGYVAGGRTKRVELEPPDRVRFRPNRQRDATISFLENAGFLAGPPPDIKPPLGRPEDEHERLSE
ncbi:MAG: hypothetical protein Q8P18_05820 [Pseudomonadota bacterium]|nr:hypothetical protein [Pseudomonadota bacterium]